MNYADTGAKDQYRDLSARNSTNRTLLRRLDEELWSIVLDRSPSASERMEFMATPMNLTYMVGAETY